MPINYDSTNDEAKISIITPAYNSEATITDTVKSVLSQTIAPYEYIVIDGKSSDNTVELVKSFRAEFEEKGIILKIISEKDNGIYDAMNKGIDNACGDIVGIINSDDWYEPIAVETVTRIYKEKGFDMFFADLRLHKNNGMTIVKRARNRKYATSRDWNHPTTFITARMYEKYRYNTKHLHDDYDLILRMKKDDVHIEIANKVLANFRMNGVSHERSLKKSIGRFKEKYEIYRINGYPFYYGIECFLEELIKLIIG